MDVNLPPELDRVADALVASGSCASRGAAVEVIRKVVLARLKSEIQKGLDDIEAGRTHVLDRAMIERIKLEGRRRLAEKGLRDSRRDERRTATTEGEPSAERGDWSAASEAFDWVMAESRRRLSADGKGGR